jgi:predicted 3-demethylubiquinone-9 3-methyltransferase (glyoxalase superfamily)
MEAMMTKGSKEQMERVVAAFMPMKKLDVAVLQKAYDGA